MSEQEDSYSNWPVAEIIGGVILLGVIGVIAMAFVATLRGM